MKRSASIVGIVLVLAACSLNENKVPKSHVMDSWIDPAIVGNERAIIQAEIKNVPPEHRKNFIFVDLNGKVYVNRPSLRSGIEFLKPTRDPSVAINSLGEREYFPLPSPKPSEEDFELLAPSHTVPENYAGCRANGGAYRRMMTKEGCRSGANCNGYTYGAVKANVNVEGASSSTINLRDNETAFFFFNMWGVRTDAEPTNYPVIDASLQYSEANRDWALVLSYYSRVTGRREALPENRMRVIDRFAPNQVLELGLYIPADNRVAMVGSGKMANRAGSDIITIYLAVRVGFPVSGRAANGSDINMGHNIAIAQKGVSDYVRSGSYFRGTAIQTTRLGYMTGPTTARLHDINNVDRAIVCARPPDVFIPSRVTPGGIDIEL